MPFAPIQQPDGMTTSVAYGCGPFRTRVRGVCVARTTIRQARRCARWYGGACAAWRYYWVGGFAPAKLLLIRRCATRAPVYRRRRGRPAWGQTLFLGISGRGRLLWGSSQGICSHNPAQLEGATGGSWRRSGVRRLRLRALQARGPGGTGIRPGAQRPHAIRRYRLTDGVVILRECRSCAVNGSATPSGPTNAARSAEGRCVPLAKTTGTRMSAVKPRRRAHSLSATRRSAPSFCEGSKNPPRKGGKHEASRGAHLCRGRFRVAVWKVNRMSAVGCNERRGELSALPLP